MYSLDKDKARRILVDELHYPDKKVDMLLESYPPIDNRLAFAMEQWLNNRTIAEVDIEGLSIGEVMSKQGVIFLVAVRKLNELLDENIPVEKRNKMRNLLGQQVYYE